MNTELQSAGGGGHDGFELTRLIRELQVGVNALAELRRADVESVQMRHKQLVERLEKVEQSLLGVATKSDLNKETSDLRARINEIQSMEATLRELSLQTIRTSFQGEAASVEQKISLGSQQRYVALEGQMGELKRGLEKQADEINHSLERKISEARSSLEIQITKVDAGLEAKIKGHVIQGIIWGMGLVGGIVAIAVGLLRVFG